MALRIGLDQLINRLGPILIDYLYYFIFKEGKSSGSGSRT